MHALLRLLGLLGPTVPVLCITIITGILGFLCPIGLTVLGAHGCLIILRLHSPFTLSQVFRGIALLGVLRSILRYLEQYSGHYVAFKLLANIRHLVFLSLRKLCPAKLEVKDKGNLIALITSDIELLEVFYAHTVAPIVIAMVTSFGMIGFIAQYSLAVAALSASGYFLIGFVVPMLATRNQAETRAFRNEVGEMTSFLLDNLRGLRETIQFRVGDRRLIEMGVRLNALTEKERKFKFFEGFIRGLTNSLILGYSIVGVLIGIAVGLGFPELLIAIVALTSSFGPVAALSALSGNLNHTIASAERVLALLDEKPQVDDTIDGADVKTADIQIRGLNFSYLNELILKDLSVEIPPNTLVGISGRSGSGKSTFLKLLMRFWNSPRGSIVISGHDISDISTDSLRSLEGYLTQDTILFNETIEENIKIAKLSATHEEVVVAAQKASIHEFINSLPRQYETTVGELGDRLSGGERQRIGLARAFLHDSPLLLLDEPTSNLDSLNESIILNSVADCRKLKTIIFVSHRPSSLSIADSLIKIENGRRC
jgi:ABC-type multidrug transport system fused ATPase/permease subunit